VQTQRLEPPIFNVCYTFRPCLATIRWTVTTCSRWQLHSAVEVVFALTINTGTD
jgi:hypothetical protein